jgi:dipeptidyl aminopeptidase/acylaminoacyl peptidase
VARDPRPRVRRDHEARQDDRLVGGRRAGAADLTWSPDGKTIALSRLHWAGRNDPVVGTVRYGDQPPASGKIQVVNVASGAVSDLHLPATSALLPGDVNWSPDSRSLLFSHCPASTTGSDSAMPGDCGDREIAVDGTGLKELPGWGGPQFLPDEQHIVVQNNVFDVMNADGTGLRPVNVRGMDVSELAQGFRLHRSLDQHAVGRSAIEAPPSGH